MFEFKKVSIFYCRSLDESARKHWKMREYHVFFLYYAYALFSPFETRFTAKAKKLFYAMKHLLQALYLTKGFSMQVCTCVCVG